MSENHILGTIFCALGVLMATFHRPLGVGFCKVGKRIWRGNPFRVSRRFYDEKGAPWVMLFLGVVFALEGVVFWFLPSHE